MAAPIDAVGAKSSSTNILIRRIISYTVLTIFAFLALFPFFLLIIQMTRSSVEINQGFKPIPGGSFWENFKTVMNNNNWRMLKALRNSLIVSGLTAFLSTYFSALTAYAIHVYDFKLRKFLFTFILMIMMVPAQVSALGFVRLVTDMGLTNSYIPLVIPSIAAPATFFFMKQYMESSLPLDIVEAARIDGSGEFRTFNSLILPILKPAIAVQAIFTFVSSWNNFFIPALILDDPDKKTLPIVIQIIRSQDLASLDLGAVYVAIGISIVPVAVVYLILSKFIIRGIALGAVKG
ncbi:MAG: carbohydrate ABC transporter permease [Ruminococcus sp.]|nr:carbohydrate ABC transporter permease [Ruminococcus sp.]SDB48202.1 carbohydrate ABC transporter membrane protein 2, CUT1 family (TC 3.A.1.1.-) [Ruminococcaceae bacterium FB2012]